MAFSALTRTILMAATIGGGVMPLVANAASTTLTSAFSVSLKGVPVATFKNNVTLNGNSYKIDGAARTNKFVSMIANSKGFVTAAGRINGTKVVPTKQDVSYRSGKKKGSTSLTFSGANVTKVNASPKIKIKPDTVKLKPSHSKNVLDPVSALVFPVSNGNSAGGKDVCNRTIAVFDGKSRMTLRFSYKGKGRSRAKGYSGAVYRCGVRYTPVAGHRKSNKGTNFMKKQSNIEVRMARIGTSNVFGLIGFTVPTRIGMVNGEATKFKVW